MALRGLSKGLSGVIGLGQEAYQHNKDKKANAAFENQRDDKSAEKLEGSEEYDDIKDDDENDEDDWIADEAQEQLDHDTGHEQKQDSDEEAIGWFQKRHPNPATLTQPTALLPAPVVVPQKRPEMRSRGFVRAYAPALQACSVEEAAFLDFIEGFQREIKKHGWFNVSNIAIALSVLSYTIAVAPSAAVHFSALAVHTSIEAGRRLYISKKSNSYIDEINAYYFQPRGLYAMIMAYEPRSKDSSKTLDFESTTALAVGQRTNENRSKLSGFKASSGKTLDQQMPEVCPLIFPELEKATEDQKENAFKRCLAFTRDYYDRRSQAEFASKHADSKLNVRDPQFAGSHGDPRTSQNSGVIGMLSGGRIDPRRRRWEGRNRRRQARGMNPRSSGGRQPGIIKRTLGEHVLYLMVVNMPSAEELQAAKEAEERMKKENPNWWEKLMGTAPGGS